MKFTPNDFKGKGFVVPVESNVFQELADIANAKLAEWLEKSPEMFCRLDSGYKDFWAADQHPCFARATHKARLVDIQEIK